MKTLKYLYVKKINKKIKNQQLVRPQNQMEKP